MRSGDVRQESLFTVRELDDVALAMHSMQPIRERMNQVLVRLDSLFAQIYADDAKGGRPSITPPFFSERNTKGPSIGLAFRSRKMTALCMAPGYYRTAQTS